MKQAFWKNRSVFLSGHTGFKGGWLALWLSELGAKVHGYSLEMPSNPNFFSEIKLEDRIESSTIGDIRDLDKLISAMCLSKASVVIHMAAQSLVRESYNSPLETFTTNAIGSMNILEAVRESDSVKSMVMITSDKAYRNVEWIWGYKEDDLLGGEDPYSSSKGCAELATSAYTRSFFSKNNSPNVASVRAGNVIGGGDWSNDRLIPDILRAFQNNNEIIIRNPKATRPWQHVLEPLGGYLLLAEQLASGCTTCASAFNFGPLQEANCSVRQLVEVALQHWAGEWQDLSDATAPHEATRLHLQIDKAYHHLNWRPRWNFDTTIARTVAWYRAIYEGGNALDYCMADLDTYQQETTNDC
mgnify:CR=1 FL=1